MLFSLSLILSAPINALDFYQDQLMAPAAEVTPNLSLLDNGKIRVGIDSSRGGSITYLSLSNVCTQSFDSAFLYFLSRAMKA